MHLRWESLTVISVTKARNALCTDVLSPLRWRLLATRFMGLVTMLLLTKHETLAIVLAPASLGTLSRWHQAVSLIAGFMTLFTVVREEAWVDSGLNPASSVPWVGAPRSRHFC